MTITPIGYLFFCSLFLGALLMFGVSRRRSKNGESTGLFANLYLGTILIFITISFVMDSVYIVKSSYEMLSFPKYEATIVDFTSEWVEHESKNSDGHKYTENVLMHTPILKFTDDTGQSIIQEGEIRSSDEPIIGDEISIAYKAGELLMLTPRSIGLSIGLSVCLLILAYILAEVLSFVFGFKSKWVDRLGTMSFTLLIYGGMFSMLGGMLYGGVYQYFQPGSDVHRWAMLVALFFSLTLAFTLVSMIYTVLREKYKS